MQSLCFRRLADTNMYAVYVGTSMNLKPERVREDLKRRAQDGQNALVLQTMEGSVEIAVAQQLALGWLLKLKAFSDFPFSKL